MPFNAAAKLIIAPVTCNAVPNATTCSTAGCASPPIHEGGPLDLDGPPARLARHFLAGRAAREQPPPRHVGQPVTTLGLVHVMRGDQKREPRRRQHVDLLPEIATGLGVHTGSRFVQQQQLRLVHQAGGQRQSLFPAARQIPRPIASRRSARPSRSSARATAARAETTVDARNEVQVLLDAQILP